MALKWRDERLRFINLQAEKVKNIIDDSAVLRVMRNGSEVLSSSEDTENKLIFRGGENWLQYQRFYSQLFHCNFFLHWYPFDYQV